MSDFVIENGVLRKFKGRQANVVIPDAVTKIGDSAFSRCSSHTSVTIPDSVTEIDHSAFWSCSGLKGVYITDLAKWCGIKFSDNPLIYAHNLYLNGDLVTDLVIPDSVKKIGDSVFSYCSSLTSVTIPNSVTEIGENAFSECESLTIHAPVGSFAEKYAKENRIKIDLIK